jgi:hypothetical protein
MTDMDVMHATEATLEQYLGGLTKAGMDEAANIEAELNALVAQGFSARMMLAVIRAVPAIRMLSPTARVEGIFEMAVVHGVNVLKYSLESGTQQERQSAHRRITRNSSARLVR